MSDTEVNKTCQSTSREYEQSRFSVPHHVLRSEQVYGTGFQSPGGLTTFQQVLLPELPLEMGQLILDVGCGLGGAAFYLTKAYAVNVVGLDLSDTMLSIAEERQRQWDSSGRIKFVRGTVFSPELQPGSFDAVYSQDTFMYVADKPASLARLAQLLKPGGKLVISDFCRGQTTPLLEDYVNISGLDLVTVPAYAVMMEAAGFTDVIARDISADTAKRLRHDLDNYLRLVSSKTDVLESDKEHLVARWNHKIGLLETLTLAQGLLCASTTSLEEGF
ncbi:hypothetical protein NLG97_g1659 [Lecanicillium saksenae]|uniref:Uncharacterized protein n=1 Tax=Lecanicillium saksenae TaxID=468837 RepID=A0ACC1R511_9HYPO|nr:hypothetical protein NLG97_g1659 [Lecanicillium saksenae]